jgi:RNA polymerase sigma factor (sigma-70 family)
VPNPEEICARTEQKTALRDAIAKLRPTLRHVIELYDLQECSLHETAEALGISVTAAKGRLFHAQSRTAQDSKIESRRSIELMRPYICIRG